MMPFMIVLYLVRGQQLPPGVLSLIMYSEFTVATVSDELVPLTSHASVTSSI
jgi:hypothetical protein